MRGTTGRGLQRAVPRRLLIASAHVPVPGDFLREVFTSTAVGATVQIAH